MKYGETLRQRSIPAWSHYNIDYDDIKQYIKEQTTPGKGKTIAVPGRPDEKLQQFETSLFDILKDQHHRIDLFVRSKAGEIQRRLDHSKRQLKSLSTSATLASDKRIPVGRLERYGRLENDVIKAGDEIRSLARFTSTQRTAFRKLLKKYKKWTGSTHLEDRFRDDVLDDPKSFMKLDMGDLLDNYSTTLQQIRSLYAACVQQGSGDRSSDAAIAGSAPSVIGELQAAIDSGSNVQFDSAIAAVALGEAGTFASYFVHPENVVELQVLLLQHSRYFLTRSRSNSVVSPLSSAPQNDAFGLRDAENADYFALEADDAERFAKEQNALTIVEREHRAGSTPQKARLCVRWTNDEEAHVAYQPGSGALQRAMVKKKCVGALFNRDASFAAKKAAATTLDEQPLAMIKRRMDKDDNLNMSYMYSSCRSRFVGINNGPQSLTMATLDTHVANQRAEGSKVCGDKTSFPFALLLVRQEASATGGLLAALDQSHLLERVRGFSMEYHAIWETARSASIPPPFWLPVLDRDIRKLPPPAMKRMPSTASSADRTPQSRGSANGVTDSTTAVETGRSDSATQELEAPPIRSFRKKRRRDRTQEPIGQKQPKYWSEYDHPEDGDANDAYVIYMDPNQKSAFEAMFSRLGGIFSRRKKPAEEEALLTEPATPRDSESSDDDNETATIKPPRVRAYGTLLRPSRAASGSHRAASAPTPAPSRFALLPQMTAVSYVASLIILAVAYLLASTGRHRQRYQVDVGVVLAVGSSLFFAIVGFAALLRRPDVSVPAWGLGVLVLVVDAVGAGGLLAWMLG
ncbi:hypothetical protein LTR53_002470 [Teratosphaeriaceae sp. CCFEE 6253]|nr:hypothetical protein LTR53_002470 [Teratosphaeriaceae sp. CCFEE 6253]